MAVAAAAWLMAAPPLAAGDTLVSRPRRVTVFPEGALVERTGSIQLGAGHHLVLIPDLPASADEASLRLAAVGPAGTKLFGVQVKSTYSPEEANVRRRELGDRIRALQDKLEDLADRMAARAGEIELLKAMGGKAAERAGSTGGDFTAAATAAGRRLASLIAENRKDERAKRPLNDQIGALQAELNQLGEGARMKTAAEADLELATGGEVQITLTYQVSGASWSPLYDLHLEGTGAQSTVAIGFGAQVRQTSGEDWNDVNVTLSTIRPAAGGQIPDPTNWWLDMYQPQPVYKAERRKGGARPAAAPAMREAMAMEDGGGGGEPVPVEVQMASTVRSEFATNFIVARAVSIPSGEAGRRVSVSEARHPATVSVVVVPRLAQSAFVEAEVRYAAEVPLMPGPANIFRGSDLVATTALPNIAPGETVRLGFGTDQNIKVERKPFTQQAGKGGVFTKSSRKYKWVTTIRNFHDGARTVEVREQLPRSRRKEIAIEPGDMSPTPLDEDPERPALYRWNLSVPSRGESKVIFAYGVKFPEGWQVTGLE